MKVVASHNGLEAARQAWHCLKEGAHPLKACVDGVTLVEDDPEELTVGYGGLPNEAGVVELDAGVMDGRTLRGAGVAALQRIRHAAKVAHCLLEQTTRVLLVGEGALEFARANGFAEEDLLTERARKMWLYWKRSRSSVDDWRTPPRDEDLDLQAWFDKHFYRNSDSKHHGTVHCAAQNAQGDLACATTTSGHAFKLPGRVGDSPILGAGLYADNEAGSCGSIGHGEANLRHLSSFAVVQRMRSGASPLDAAMQVLQDIADRCEEDWKDDNGRPKFNLQLFILNASGEHQGAAIWPGKQIAVVDEAGPRLEDCVSLY